VNVSEKLKIQIEWSCGQPRHRCCQHPHMSCGPNCDIWNMHSRIWWTSNTTLDGKGTECHCHIVNYLIAVITSIFENSLTSFAFLPRLFFPFFSKDRNLLLFFSFVSFFCSDQFIFMQQGSEDRCFTPFS